MSPDVFHKKQRTKKRIMDTGILDLSTRTVRLKREEAGCIKYDKKKVQLHSIKYSMREK